ncbi:MAG: hypothetical protein EOO38_09505 [Cytophagaceae bacterium]|nr:MAG: hypothetical protein EOO38_09505 [Cytophagaceae bacterium]
MTTQYSYVSYIAAADADQPAAASWVDYRSDLVATVSNQIREVIGDFLSRNNASKALSPVINVHAILDGQKLEEYRKFFRALDKYNACTLGWNAQHSAAPSAEQLEIATKAVASLIVAGAPAPNAMLLDDGTIGAYWRNGETYASIDFDTDGEHPWAGTDGERYWSGVWQPSSTLPEQLSAELKSIAG